MTDEKPLLLILGASTRSAAHSAVRAGFAPVCADVFSDEDLRAVAQVLPIARYPRGLIKVARQAPQCPWMYTGALENHPDLVTAVSQLRPLWGNPPDVLAAVRDPYQIQALLKAADLPALEVRPATNPPSRNGRWLRKPLRGGAGRHIQSWTRKNAHAATDEPHYFQRKAEGTSMSAVYLAAGGTAWLIGTSRQLIGPTVPGGPPFKYCGSVGPWEVSAELRDQIRQIGEVLARETGLHGLFGGDFLCDDRSAWLVEINPRYTASIEIFEHAYGMALLDWHSRACRSPVGQTLSTDVSAALRRLEDVGPARVVGKMILYAPHKITTPPPSAFRGTIPGTDIPRFADIPSAGQVITAGHPICTVFAAADVASHHAERDGYTAAQADCLQNLFLNVRDAADKILNIRDFPIFSF